MTARDKTYRLSTYIQARTGKALPFSAVNDLRRAQLTLHRWAELECGDGNDYASWAIERDEKTDKPYLCRYPHSANKPTRTPVADRERGALVRVQRICKEHGLHYFYQTDPRGCALYVSREPLTDSDYTNGVAVAVAV